jgi:glycosyltransferase involved in cell wall biosynthesis
MTAPIPLLHRMWRRLPAGPRRRVAAHVAALVAPRREQPRLGAPDGIIVAGELTRASGLGEGARLMLRGLSALGVPAWPVDVGRFLPAHRADLPPPGAPAGPPPVGATLVLHVNPPLLPLVLARLPRALTRDRRIVGYWSWELPQVPAEWRPGARFVHAAWVPSRFTADSVAHLTGAPISVVRPPIATAPLSPAPLGRVEFGLPEEAVVVLVSFNLASSFVRKNPLGALDAFRIAFGTRSDRVLVLKVGNADHFPDDFAQIVAAVNGATNIRLMTEMLAPAAALALTSTADIVMSLHRSEGLGLVPAEGMLLGKPVIATGWSGTLEFMDESCAALIRYRLIPAEDPRGVYGVQGSFWADPDVRHAAEWLRRLADDPTLRRCLGEAGRTAALGQLGTASLAAAMDELGIQTNQLPAAISPSPKPAYHEC